MLPVGVQTYGGYDKAFTDIKQDREAQTVKYDRTFQEVSEILKDARENSSDAENNTYQGINGYLDNLLANHPSKTHSADPVRVNPSEVSLNNDANCHSLTSDNIKK